jgi:aldehyde:ferredoxin oxidoreductase
MNRRLLHLDATKRCWWLETLDTDGVQKDPREDYFVLTGEPLCQYLLRRHSAAMIIARGPMPFLSGNKATIGYISPLTGVPHYSFVGGRAAAQLLNLGLDAICLQPPQRPEHQDPQCYVVVSGRAPALKIEFKPAQDLPAGQRSAFYWLLEHELDDNRHVGSIFTIGEGALLGYRSANLAVEAIYHAGRGGAGAIFARLATALVLRGEPMEQDEFFADADTAFARNPNATIAPLLDTHCARLSAKTGGTIQKLYDTGANPPGQNTLPASNARRLGYSTADIASPRMLRATRKGQTGCHWCQVDCRHWHWVPADYAPSGRDMLLDDFEPTYAIFAMLGLTPAEDTLSSKLHLLTDVNQRIMLPIEQMGCDVINIGLGLAALFEGLGQGLVPGQDVPGFLRDLAPEDSSPGCHLETAASAVAMLRTGEAVKYPALRAVGDGPQALAEEYPAMQDIVFTSGKATLGNAGHCNALWTFLMPFSRFFGHYVGQYYKVDEELPAPGSDQESYRLCFERTTARLLRREFYWLLGNALSLCAFTFVVFSQDGQGEALSDDARLVRLLRNYDIHTSRADLMWFSQAFWAQSIRLKCDFGWRPTAASDLPRRVYEGLSLALERSPGELMELMDMLIDEWKRQAGSTLRRFGYQVPW